MAAHLKIIITAIILGTLFTILGLTAVLIWPSVLNSVLSKQTSLSNHSGSYAEWTNSTMPMRIEVYLFNWTNPHLTSNGSIAETPKLEQLGPYVFREHREKIILGWNDENQTVTYLENRTWFFEPWLSKGNLSDLVTTIDIPAVTTAYGLKDASKFWKETANYAFNHLFHVKLTVTKSVDELIFRGYSSLLLDFARTIPKKYLPFPIPFDKFGWFYTRNGSATYDGTFNMNTGAKDIKEQGKLEKWDYENHTYFYPSHCGAVNGSAGELFGGGRERTSISFYSPDICRPVILQYDKDVKTSGISAYRYTADPHMFSNKTSVPDNWCYYKGGPKDTQADGVLDISSCKWGAPLFVSFPHFYQADPSYRAAVIGMNPDPTQHQMLLDVEPMTGVPIHASAGLQINVLIQPIKAFSFLENVSKIYFPSIWFREIADVNGSTEEQLQGLGNLAKTPIILGYVVLSIGVSVLVIVVVFIVAQRCRKDDEADDYLINPSSTTNESD